MNRKTSRVAFAFVIASAAVLTCITLHSLIAGFTRFETLFLLIGCLILIWAMISTFFEVRRIAARSQSICERPEIDPDTSCLVIVEPPTGHPYPHHEDQAGSAGFDQGQLTSRLPDTLSDHDLLGWMRHKKKTS